MNRRKMFSILSMMLIIVSISFAQDNPMGKKMMKDSSNEKMMMDEDKMTHDKEMMKDKMMHDDMMMKINKDDNGVAIMGYDPVAYFVEGKPAMGMEKYSYRWNDAEWYFASKQHMTMFKENPDKYAPQYGGYCAYAASKGYYAETDPNAWAIHDGKLYLNHNPDICDMFKEDINSMIKKANMNWKEGKLKKGM